MTNARAVIAVVVVMVAACGPAAPSSNDPVRARPKPGRGPADVVPTTALAPDQCADAPLVALDDLRKGTGDGQRIAIDVTPQPETICTLLACVGPDGEENGPDVCCNSCGGNYGHRDGLEFSLALDGLAGCGGMDCNFHCEPFGTAPTHAYRFVGVAKYTPRGVTAVYDQVAFKIEKYCTIAAAAK
jgi:hypothetical protein